MIGQVGTGTPLVLVCLALLRSSAGRRRLIKKEKKRSHLAWAATLPGRHKETRVRASRFLPRRGLAARCEGEEACFRPRLGRGAAKEKKAAARRLLSLPARGAQKKRIKKITMLTPQQHAPRRRDDNDSRFGLGWYYQYGDF